MFVLFLFSSGVITNNTQTGGKNIVYTCGEERRKRLSQASIEGYLVSLYTHITLGCVCTIPMRCRIIKEKNKLRQQSCDYTLIMTEPNITDRLFACERIYRRVGGLAYDRKTSSLWAVCPRAQTPNSRPIA